MPATNRSASHAPSSTRFGWALLRVASFAMALLAIACDARPFGRGDGNPMGCPPGLRQDGGLCRCPEGFVQEDDRCICPAGRVLDGGVCACPPGLVPWGLACVDPDASLPDGGPGDGGAVDGGGFDGGATDAAVDDGGVTDGGVVDGGDAFVPDGGVTDGGSGSTDGGPDGDTGVRLDGSIGDGDGGPSDGGTSSDGGVCLPAACLDADACHIGTCSAGMCVQVLRADGSPCALDSVCVSGVCVPRSCGDGYVEPGPTPAAEACDDGNLIGGDGCGPACVPEVVAHVADLGEATHGTTTGQNVGVDVEGRVLLVYRRVVGGREQLVAQRATRYGAALGAALLVDADLGLEPTFADPSVIGLRTGGWIIGWTADRGGTLDVVVRSVSPTGVLGSEMVVNRQRLGTQWDVELAALASGYVVAWTDLNSSLADPGSGVRARVFPSSGSALTQELRLAASTAGDEGQVALASAGSSWLAVWQTSDPDTFVPSVVSRAFSATGTAIDASDRVLCASECALPDVVAVPDGFVVSYESVVPTNVGGTQFAVSLRGLDPAGIPRSIDPYSGIAVPVPITSSPNASVGANAEGAVVVAHERSWDGRVALLLPPGSAIPDAPSLAVLDSVLSSRAEGRVTVVGAPGGVYVSFVEDAPLRLYDTFDVFFLPTRQP